MSFGFTSIASLQTLVTLATIGVYALIIIVTLDSIWRVEHRLNSFLKMLLAAFAVLIVRMALGIVGLSQTPYWALIAWLSNLLAAIIFLIAMIIMYKIVRRLNAEKSVKKNK